MLTGLMIAKGCMLGADLVAMGLMLKSAEKRGIKVEKQSTKVITDKQRTTKFMELFENMGIVDVAKGQWIKSIEYRCTPNYSLIAFILSDNLSSDTFIKNKSKIAEKLNKPLLEIYYEHGKMYFRARHENIPLIPYQFKATPKHLIPLGLDIEDKVVYLDLTKDSHLLICGSTGCGKSRLANAVIDHIINNCKPMLWMIDLKRGLELGEYEDIIYTKGYAEVLVDVDKVIDDFEAEGERRYTLMKSRGHRDYNEYVKEYDDIPQGFLIIDEFADITRAKEGAVIDKIVELGAKVRAVGLTIIVMTQRPTTSFISADLKANMGIIGMKAINEHNSRLIIDETGLEQLQRAEAIGLLNSKKIYFRAFNFNPSITKATCDKYRVQDIKKDKVLKLVK